MVHLGITEKPSKGYQAELQVARELQRRGWRLLFHNVKIGKVQVDLLLRDPEGLLCLVEVKSQSPAAHLSRLQARRLSRVGQLLSQFEPIEFYLAFVCEDGVQILPVDGLTDF